MLTSDSVLVTKLYDDVQDVKCNKKMVQDSVGGKFKVSFVALLILCLRVFLNSFSQEICVCVSICSLVSLISLSVLVSVSW